MSRNVRALLAIVILSFAFSAAACANVAGPRATADTSGPNVSRTADTSGPNVSRNSANVSR